VSEHLCYGDWGENFSKEIPHFDRSDLGFLDFLFIYFPACYCISCRLGKSQPNHQLATTRREPTHCHLRQVSSSL
jgi:hypothetical protein